MPRRPMTTSVRHRELPIRDRPSEVPPTPHRRRVRDRGPLGPNRVSPSFSRRSLGTGNGTLVLTVSLEVSCLVHVGLRWAREMSVERIKTGYCFCEKTRQTTSGC